MGSGVAQLVDRLFPTPEVRGSNPVIRKLYGKEESKKKRPGMDLPNT